MDPTGLLLFMVVHGCFHMFVEGMTNVGGMGRKRTWCFVNVLSWGWLHACKTTNVYIRVIRVSKFITKNQQYSLLTKHPVFWRHEANIYYACSMYWKGQVIPFTTRSLNKNNSKCSLTSEITGHYITNLKKALFKGKFLKTTMHLQCLIVWFPWNGWINDPWKSNQTQTTHFLSLDNYFPIFTTG